MGKRRSKPRLPHGDRVLAFDIAGGAGYAFGISGKLLQWGKFSADEGKPLAYRLLKLSQWVSKAVRSLPEAPEVVVIEQPYLGRNAKTHAVLNRYVGVVEREIYRMLRIQAEFLTPRNVKQILGLPKANTSVQHKKNMIRAINRIYGTNFRYVPGKSSKSKRSDDDIADAIGVLTAYWMKRGYRFDK